MKLFSKKVNLKYVISKLKHYCDETSKTYSIVNFEEPIIEKIGAKMYVIDLPLKLKLDNEFLRINRLPDMSFTLHMRFSEEDAKEETVNSVIKDMFNAVTDNIKRINNEHEMFKKPIGGLV